MIFRHHILSDLLTQITRLWWFCYNITGLFLHEIYGIYFVIIQLRIHVLIQSAHHTHCISFNTNPCTTGMSRIIISLRFHTSLCFLPIVIISASFYELQTAYIAEDYLMSHLYPLYICFVIFKVIVEIYYFVILDKVSN